MSLKDAYDVSSLADVLGIRPRSLIYYVYRLSQEEQYEEFEIPKKSGGVRLICAPNSNLVSIQEKIKAELEELREFRPCVNGFVKQRDIIRNARFHLRRSHVLNIDIEDFFGSITFPRIYGLLTKAPYYLNSTVAACVAKACTYKDILPQGAPSSPVITNLICARMDSELTRMAKKYRCRYSRYADDMTFSFNRQPPSALVEFEEDDETGEVISVVAGSELRKIISDNWFVINDAKTRLLKKSQRQEVTGLIVNEKLNVKRRFVRQIRAMIHAWKKFGYDNADKEYREKYSLTAHQVSFDLVLRGKILFLKQVRGATDPLFLKYAHEYNTLPNVDQIRILPTSKDLALSATWVIESEKGVGIQGTAFFLEGVGIVTCAHCVGPNLQIWHPRDPSKKYPLSVQKINETLDIAICDIPAELTNNEMLVEGELSQPLGEAQIRLLGYPNHSLWKPIKNVEGTVIRTYPRFGCPHYEVDTPIIEGNSGGPLLDSSYGVIGVAIKGVNENTNIAEAEHVAISISALKRL